jgi:hypothetical protein
MAGTLRIAERRSLRCAFGFHKWTTVPLTLLEQYADDFGSGAVEGAIRASRCPWPGGFYGPTVEPWCVRCGNGNDARDALARLEAALNQSQERSRGV